MRLDECYLAGLEAILIHLSFITHEFIALSGDFFSTGTLAETHTTGDFFISFFIDSLKRILENFVHVYLHEMLLNDRTVSYLFC